MTDIADIFALAEMYSELTKCSLETALTDINTRIKAVKATAECYAATERVIEQIYIEPPMPPIAPPLAQLAPYSTKAFLGAMKWATPGQGYTVAELCSAAGIVYPPGSKGSTHKLIAAGWTKTDLRRTGQNCKCSVYVKPAGELLRALAS